MEFWQRLANLMSAFDIKSKELAHKAGVSQRHINAIASGERPDPKVSTAAAIARALDVSLDWLVAGEKAKPEKLTGDEELFLDLYRQLPEDLKALAVQTLLGFAKQVQGKRTD
jgi:transcriptional regulator with XRE-family HTH domain